MRNILLVIAGVGLGADEAARVQRAVAEALLGADGEPRIYAVTMNTPQIDDQEGSDAAFAQVMHMVASAAREVFPHEAV